MEYFKVDDFKVGEIPFSAIHLGLQKEKYFRKFRPSGWNKDLKSGIPAAVLYWYPSYIDCLFEFAVYKKDFRIFFLSFPPSVLEDFEYLFPDIVKKLESIPKENKTNHLGETIF